MMDSAWTRFDQEADAEAVDARWFDEGLRAPADDDTVSIEASPDAPLCRALGWASGFADSGDLTFIVDSGSLLGLQRDGCALPRDPDLDLSLCLSSEAGLQRLRDGLAGIPHNLWTFEGRPYKVEIEARALGLPLSIDIKIFRMTPLGWVCPSVYPIWRGRTGGAAVGGPNGRARLRRQAHAWLRQHWRRLMARGDAAHWPLRAIMHADVWVVPEPYFAKLERVPGFPGCARPANWKQYLDYRYGDWGKPVSGWVYWRDDGAYRCLDPDTGHGHVDDLRRLWGCS